MTEATHQVSIKCHLSSVLQQRLFHMQIGEYPGDKQEHTLLTWLSNLSRNTDTHTHVYITGRVFINILNSSEVKAIKLGCEHETPRGWMMLRYGLRNGFLESNKHYIDIYICVCTYCVLYLYTYMLVLFNRSVVWESRSTSGCFAIRWCLAVMFVGLYTH